MKISPARVAAFDILKRIETDQAFSSVLLPEYEAALSPKDRSLCHQLTLGVLRKQIYLDRIIDHFSGGKKIDVAVRVILRLGLFQLNFLDKVPDHSAVDESVSLVQRAKKSSAKGFVNAILRGSLREPFLPVYGDEIERLSVESSHPRWLVEKWIAEFGVEVADSLTRSNNEQPRQVFRLTAKSRPETKYDGVDKSDLVESAFVSSHSTPELLAASERGVVYFQDEGSQLVAGAVSLPAGASFLDVCAAPGSKVTQVAVDNLNNGNLIVAGDLNEKRIEFLAYNCRNQGASGVQIVRYDAESALPFADRSFNVVLVDAPCSGTGTIRHNPEIRYSLSADDFSALAAKQRRILSNASKKVGKGGRLIYSTCSLEREENEGVADRFLEENPDFIKSSIEVDKRFHTADGYARTRPDRDGFDGFFIAVFKRL